MFDLPRDSRYATIREGKDDFQIMDYKNFLKRLALFASKNPKILTMTLQNIFSMRSIGNKTHGDMAEIAISEFINQYMYDFSSKHVGKDLFRSKKHEEDILIIDEISHKEIPVSLKAYGVGPLQLSTDKKQELFQRLQKEGELITGDSLTNLLKEPCFDALRYLYILPLIYNEKKNLCNIVWFDIDTALNATSAIRLIASGSGRKHPIYRFEDTDGNYICEVRYGDAKANALQRGFWTHTENASAYFCKLFDDWVHYEPNQTLLDLISHILVASEKGHSKALEEIKKDIESIKNGRGC